MNWRGRIFIVSGVLVVATALGWVLLPEWCYNPITYTKLNLDSGYIRTERSMMGICLSRSDEQGVLARELKIPESFKEAKGRWVLTSAEMPGVYGKFRDYDWSNVILEINAVSAVLTLPEVNSEYPGERRADIFRRILTKLRSGKPDEVADICHRERENFKLILMNSLRKNQKSDASRKDAKSYLEATP